MTSGDKLYLKNGLVYDGNYEGMVQGKLIFIYAVTNSRIRFNPNDILKVIDDEGNIIMKGEEIVAQSKQKSEDKPVKKSAVPQKGGSLGLGKGLSVWVKPTYMGLSGADIHLIDAFFQKYSLSPSGTLLYRIGSHKVDLEYDRRWSPFLGVNFNVGNRWSISGEIYRFSTHAKEWGITKAPSSPYFQYLSGVRLWENLFLLRNDKDPSGFSPIEWSGETDLGITSADLYASFALLTEIHRSVKLNFGLKIISMKQSLERSIKGQSYVYTPTVDEGIFFLVMLMGTAGLRNFRTIYH